MAEVVCLSVALVLAIAQLIIELQMSTLPKRFAIRRADNIAAIVGGRRIITSRIVGRILTELILDAEQVDFVIRYILVLTVAGIPLQAHHDISALGIQPSVELKHRPGILILAIGKTSTLVVVNDVRQQNSRRIAESSQWVGNV